MNRGRGNVSRYGIPQIYRRFKCTRIFSLLRTSLQKEVRYTIPPFQRPYVWSQDDQWEPLWEDVRNVAETYLEELERSGNTGSNRY